MSLEVFIEKYEGTFSFMSPTYLKTYREFFCRMQGKTREEFIQILKKCVCCPVRNEARQVVPPEGSFDSDIVLCGRNPGRSEDLHGRPFFPTAPGGKWFEKYLEGLSLKRQDVYITNSLFCYTKKDRMPEWTEISVCMAWKVLEMFYLKNLRYLFLMGNDAIREFFGQNTKSIVRIFGVVYQMRFNGRPLMVFPVYHPAYVLRKDTYVEATFSYLKTARSLIDEDRKGNLRWD